jgi:hypothetical protein
MEYTQGFFPLWNVVFPFLCLTQLGSCHKPSECLARDVEGTLELHSVLVLTTELASVHD